MQSDKKNSNRDAYIRIRVTDEEYDKIKANKEKSGVKTVSAYIRKMAIDGYIINTDFTTFKQSISELTTAINKIGVNINQITKRLNETNNIYADDMNEIRKGMSDIWQLLKSGLSNLRRTLH